LDRKGQSGAAKWWWPFDGNFPSILGGPFPRHTGRAIGGLALRMGIALWDPIDEVGTLLKKCQFCTFSLGKTPSDCQPKFA
jgi:hypothetical protein